MSKHRGSANEDLKACDSCKNVYGTQKFIAKHYKNVHANVGKIFCSAEKDRLKRHFETHTKPQFICQICDTSLELLLQNPYPVCISKHS